jgi:hypothetical protein
MMNCIDDDLYCTGDYYQNGMCLMNGSGCGRMRSSIGCNHCHRKYPSPEEYREEYGEDLGEDFPVWLIIPEARQYIVLTSTETTMYDDWTLMLYSEALKLQEFEQEGDFSPEVCIVCACAPFGKPDNNWRPGNESKDRD